MKNRNSGGGRRKGRGTWRTNSGFGVTVNNTNTVNPFILVGNIPQAPVAAGAPEPVTQYEISNLQGGIELGSVILNAARAITTDAKVGFGLYMTDINSAGGFDIQDPLTAVDVCKDNWSHLEWWTFQYGPETFAATNPAPVYIHNNIPMRRTNLRLTSGPRILKEGKVLVGVMSVLGLAGLDALPMTPYFRYHLKVVA